MIHLPQSDSYTSVDTPKNRRSATDSGFTLMEVVVSVTIFAVVITLMLSLFNYTLNIYRRVEAQRQVSQSVRTTMEFLVKEIRNGKVDYGVIDGVQADTSVDAHCPIPTIGGNTYSVSNTSYLGLINVDGERECIYWVHDPNPALQDDPNNNNLYIKKLGVTAVSQLNPPNVKLYDLRFYVRPLRDPYMDSPNLIEQQPVVTIAAKVSIKLPTGEIRTVPYQTSVSTYIYDIPSQ